MALLESPGKRSSKRRDQKHQRLNQRCFVTPVWLPLLALVFLDLVKSPVAVAWVCQAKDKRQNRRVNLSKERERLDSDLF